MQIKPGQLIKYNHAMQSYYVVIEVKGHNVNLYSIKTGTILTRATTTWTLRNFQFL